MSAAAVGPGMGPGPPGSLAPANASAHHHSAHGHGLHGHSAHLTHPPSHASSPTSTDRIRKKSAHWSDEDTETLIDVLLQHRDSGRTADNGFKPEVWDKAAALLESNANTGGAKTPDACKSRWQRLQRDYKFARQLLTSGYGFTWDNAKHKLHASDQSWAAAEKEYGDTKKTKKIHLPCYSRLSLLCSADAPIRPRPPKGRMPSNSSTLSESSAVVPLNLAPQNGGPSGVMRQVGVPDGTRVMQHTNGHTHHQQLHAGLQPSLSITESTQVWGNEGDDSIESVEATFGLPDPNRHTFAMPHQKRLHEYDTTILGSAPGNDRKRPRPRQPQGTPTPASSTATTQPLYQLPESRTNITQTPQTPHHNPHGHQHAHHYQTPQQPQKVPPPPQTHHPHQQQQPQHQHQQHFQQPQQHLPHQQQQLISQSQSQQPQQHMIARPPSGLTQTNSQPQLNSQFSTPYHAPSTFTTRSPQYTPTITDPALPSPVYHPIPVLGNGDMGNSLLRTPQTAPDERRELTQARVAAEKPTRSETRPLAAAASMPNMPTHLRSLSGAVVPSPTEGLALSGVTMAQPGHQALISPGAPLKSLVTPTATSNIIPKSSASTGRSTPGLTSTPESDAGQRRIEAVRRLQAEELSDDDLMVLLPDFEQNNAVVETYLGLHRDQLRIRWLADKILARRRVGGEVRRDEQHFDPGM